MRISTLGCIKLITVLVLSIACSKPIGDKDKPRAQPTEGLDAAKSSILELKTELDKKVKVLKDKLALLDPLKAALDAPDFDVTKTLEPDDPKKFVEQKASLAKIESEIGTVTFGHIVTEAGELLTKAQAQQAKVAANDEISNLVKEIEQIVATAKENEAKIEAIKKSFDIKKATINGYRDLAQTYIKDYDPASLELEYKALEAVSKNTLNIKTLENDVFKKRSAEIAKKQSTITAQRFKNIAERIINPTDATKGIVGRAKAQQKIIQDELDIITDSAVTSANLKKAAKNLDKFLENSANEYKKIATNVSMLNELQSKIKAVKNVLEVKKYIAESATAQLDSVKSEISTADTSAKITDALEKLAGVIARTKIDSFKTAVASKETSEVIVQRGAIKTAAEKYSVANLVASLDTTSESKFDTSLGTLRGHLSNDIKTAIKTLVNSVRDQRVAALRNASKINTDAVNSIRTRVFDAIDRDVRQDVIDEITALNARLKVKIDAADAWKAGSYMLWGAAQKRKDYVNNALNSYTNAVTKLASATNQEKAIKYLRVINYTLLTQVDPTAPTMGGYTLDSLKGKIVSALTSDVVVSGTPANFSAIMTAYIDAADTAVDLAAINSLDRTDLAKILSDAALKTIADAAAAAKINVVNALKLAATGAGGLKDFDDALSSVLNTTKLTAGEYAVEVDKFADDFLTGDLHTDLKKDVAAADKGTPSDAQKGADIAGNVKTHSTWKTLNDIANITDAEEVNILTATPPTGLSIEELSAKTGKLGALRRKEVFQSKDNVVKDFNKLKADFKLALDALIATPIADKTAAKTNEIETLFTLHFKHALDELNAINWDAASGDWKDKTGKIIEFIGMINSDDVAKFEGFISAVGKKELDATTNNSTSNTRPMYTLLKDLKKKVQDLITANPAELASVSTDVTKLNDYLAALLKK